MPAPSVPPPLRVIQTGASSYIPVFELELSGGTVTKLSPIRVRYNPTSTTGVAASRLVNTVYPLSGGGDLSVDRTHSVDTAGFLVLSSRALNTTAPLAGGGNLSVDRTLTADTAVLVTSGRSISTLFPLSGGGDLSANRTVSVDTAFLVISTRTISTTAPLAGGGNLSADLTLTANTSVLVTSGRTLTTLFPLSGGANLSADRTFAVDTAFLVTSTRAINTTAPVVGGGNLSVDRTLTVDTSVLVTSGRSISTLFPLSGGGDLSANRTFSADTAFLVTSARTLSVAGGALAGGGDLSADRTITLGTPIAVGSGGTGQTSLTAFGVLYGSGASAIQSLLAMSAGTLIVGSSVTTSPYLLGSGATGQMLISTGGVVANVAWVATGGGGSSVVYAATGNEYITASAAADLTAERLLIAGTSVLYSDSATAGKFVLGLSTGVTGRILITSAGIAGSAAWITTANVTRTTTVRLPMALMTIKTSTGNTYWVARTSGTTSPDIGYVEFIDGGAGLATYWTTVPNNLAPTPAWNLWIYHHAGAGAAGNIILGVSAMSVAQGDSLGGGTLTSLLAGTVTSTNALNVMTVSSLSTTNFDATLTIAANDLLVCEMGRRGQGVLDTLNNPWDLYSVQLQCDVIT